MGKFCQRYSPNYNSPTMEQLKQLIVLPLLGFLLVSSFAVTADQFDSGTPNSVCFTSEDCHRASQDESQVALPLFCLSPLECLCNRQQLHSHAQMDNLLTKCLPCSNAKGDEQQVDQCTVQDPLSYCNLTSTLCECSPNIDDVLGLNAPANTKKLSTERDLRSRSVCLHWHLRNKHQDTSHIGNDSTRDPSSIGPHHPREEPVSEWMLTLLLAYVLPGMVIFALCYFIYKQGCFCGRNDEKDSEMILYRQL